MNKYFLLSLGVLYGFLWIVISALAYTFGFSLPLIALNLSEILSIKPELGIQIIRVAWAVEILLYCLLCWVPVQIIVSRLRIRNTTVWLVLLGLIGFAINIWLLIISKPQFINSYIVYLVEISFFTAVPVLIDRGSKFITKPGNNKAS